MVSCLAGSKVNKKLIVKVLLKAMIKIAQITDSLRVNLCGIGFLIDLIINTPISTSMVTAVICNEALKCEMDSLNSGVLLNLIVCIPVVCSFGVV